MKTFLLSFLILCSQLARAQKADVIITQSGDTLQCGTIVRQKSKIVCQTGEKKWIYPLGAVKRVILYREGHTWIYDLLPVFDGKALQMLLFQDTLYRMYAFETKKKIVYNIFDQHYKPRTLDMVYSVKKREAILTTVKKYFKGCDQIMLDLNRIEPKGNGPFIEVMHNSNDNLFCPPKKE